MRVLIYGGDGMLGHQLLKTLRVAHEVRVTLRQSMSNYQDSGLFDPTNSFADIVARSLLCLVDTISSFRPAPIVNCIGLVKQRDNTKDVIANLEINALLKRRLAQLCRAIGARLIHVSTDCNAVGRKGMYMEGVSDAEDIYGHTKFLDEEAGPTCLTLRTSIIGRELRRASAASPNVSWRKKRPRSRLCPTRRLKSRLFKISRDIRLMPHHSSETWSPSSE